MFHGLQLVYGALLYYAGPQCHLHPAFTNRHSLYLVWLAQNQPRSRIGCLHTAWNRSFLNLQIFVTSSYMIWVWLIPMRVLFSRFHICWATQQTVRSSQTSLTKRVKASMSPREQLGDQLRAMAVFPPPLCCCCCCCISSSRTPVESSASLGTSETTALDTSLAFVNCNRERCCKNKAFSFKWPEEESPLVPFSWSVMS